MNKKIYLLLIALLAWSMNSIAQTAEIESVTAAPGASVTFDLDVASFPSNVGAISLFIGYDPNVLTFTGTTSGTISGYIVNDMTGTSQVGIQWTNPAGQGIDGTLLTLEFTYGVLGGTCDLTFDAGCEFTDILLNNIATGYTNGNIGPTAGVATITIGDSLAVTGPVSMDLLGAGFSTSPGVAAITLFVDYDNTVMTYTGFSTTVLPGAFVNDNNGTIGIVWSSLTGVDLNQVFLTLDFNYGGVGSSALNFTGACEITYLDFTTEVVSYDNGSVSPLGTSYLLSLPDLTSPPGNPVIFGITASGYPADVGAIDLFINYNAGCLTYLSASNGTISGFMVNTIAPGQLGITWTNPGGQAIDGTLLSLNFQYLFGNCAVVFGTGSHVDDITLTPFPTTFVDGSIAQDMGGATATMPIKTAPAVGQMVEFPILVSNFADDAGAISLYIGFDDAVLTFTGTVDGTISGYFANYMPASSQIGIQWSTYPGVDIDPNGNDTLLILQFTYIAAGGFCDMTFDMGCEFAKTDLTLIAVGYYNGALILGTKFDVKAFLEGPFSSGTMTTALTPYLPLAQPFSGPPWNYAGTETVVAIPANVTDWVLLEIRETTGGAATATPATMVGQRAGFMLNDGTITDLDGVSEMLYNLVITDDAYAVVYHRNHLAIMSASALIFDNVNNNYPYDFTDALAKAYLNGQKDLGGGFFGMVGGDGDGNGDINLSDVNLVFVPQFGSPPGYWGGDFDMDGDVDLSDLNLILVVNFGQITKVP